MINSPPNTSRASPPTQAGQRRYSRRTERPEPDGPLPPAPPPRAGRPRVAAFCLAFPMAEAAEEATVKATAMVVSEKAIGRERGWGVPPASSEEC